MYPPDCASPEDRMLDSYPAASAAGYPAVNGSAGRLTLEADYQPATVLAQLLALSGDWTVKQAAETLHLQRHTIQQEVRQHAADFMLVRQERAGRSRPYVWRVCDPIHPEVTP